MGRATTIPDQDRTSYHPESLQNGNVMVSVSAHHLRIFLAALLKAERTDDALQTAALLRARSDAAIDILKGRL